MATSTIPALKASLVSLLQARTGLMGVQVTYGPPLPAEQREFIAVGLTEGEQEWVTMGAPRREEYDQYLVVSVQREGTDSQAADSRCFALFAELENLVRGDITIGGIVNAAILTSFSLGSGVSLDGMSRTSQLTVRLHCTAFI